jgi:tetraacyldisaccharide 4'-kinase
MRRPWVWPLAPLYRAGLALREIGLRSGISATRRLQWPVVSIGNLSTGGSGKTPLTIALAKALTARGVPVDVLSRGYGRRAEDTARVDTNGTAAEFGDEPLEIARATGVPVYLAAQRYEAGVLAEQSGQAGSGLSKSGSPSFGLHLLDDGFQHRQLARDVDILLMSAWDLEDHLLPAGNLREPLRAAKRADVIAIPADESDLENTIRARGWKGPVWRLRRQMDVPPIEGPVAAFCGIARPEQFFAGLEAAGLRVAARLAFGDHHSYNASDIERIVSEARSVGAMGVLTTEKDRVRMAELAGKFTEPLSVQAVPLRVEIENEAVAIDWLMKRIADPRGQRESPR